MSSTGTERQPRFSAALREGSRVTSLELFFDLVFVLALTQCTSLIYAELTWSGMLKGLLVLGVLWWSWVGYSWLTSVVDPEEGTSRLVVLAATAALLVDALCVPHVFSDEALLFACAYAVVRSAHIALFAIASRGDAMLRRSVAGLAVSTAIGVGILVAASFVTGTARVAFWGVALALDMAGPRFFGSEGWRLVPSHFAERYGGIVIIALGESIAAIGGGAPARLSAGIVTAAVLGVVVAGAMWWLYFDLVAIVAQRRLTKARPGRERNEIARDSFSYLHLPMIAGIVLVAVGIKRSLGEVSHPLGLLAATAMLGGAALYLLAHVAFRWRNMHRFSTQRVTAAALLGVMLLLDAELHPSALLTLGVLAAVLSGLIVYETLRFAELRDRLRHQVAAATRSD